jgi:hypothetical protein
MSKLTRFLKLVTGAEQPRGADGPLPQSESRDILPRAELRAALARVEAAKLIVEEAAAGTARAREVIAAAKDAQEEADRAQAECVAAATAHAAAGATGSVAQELFDRAEATRSKAFRADLMAQGARKALASGGDIIEAEAAARETLQRAQHAVGEAVTRIVRAEADPIVARARELRTELRELEPLLVGLSYMQKYAVPFRSVGIGREDYSRYSEDQLRELVSPWLAFGNKLSQDADAKFDVVERVAQILTGRIGR